MKKNPFKNLYFSFAYICCFLLCIIFLIISINNAHEKQRKWEYEKLENVTNEFDVIINNVKKVKNAMTINTHFQPYFFKQNKYYEINVVDDLKWYVNILPIADACFLYYGDNSIFHSDGSLISIDSYTNNWSMEEIKDFKEALLHCDNMNFVIIGYDLYIIQPFKIMGEYFNSTNASLGIVVPLENLEERVYLVTGGLEGELCVFHNNKMIYSNKNQYMNDITFYKEKETTLKQEIRNDAFTLIYLPNGLNFFDILMPYQIVMIMMTIFIIVVLAGWYARYSYSPIKKLSKEIGKISGVDGFDDCRSVFEDIEYITKKIFQNNQLIAEQLEKKTEILRQQVLYALFTGDHFDGMEDYLDYLKINSSNMIYFVFSILYTQRLTKQQLAEIQESFQGLNDDTYCVQIVRDNRGSATFLILCGVTKEEKEEATELLIETAQSFGYEVSFGKGNAFDRIQDVRKSYVESLDDLCSSKQEMYKYEQDRQKLYLLFKEIRENNREEALKKLDEHIKYVLSKSDSFLMQKYSYAVFVSEITRFADQEKIELSNSSVSSMIVAKNTDEFSEIGRAIINEFCDQIQRREHEKLTEKTDKILQYLDMHYKEEQLTMQGVAAALGLTLNEIRSSLMENKGMSYKEYLIYLRLEEAKRLLLGEGTVLEIGRSVGYNTPSFFIKAFKEYTGMTPSTFRSCYQSSELSSAQKNSAICE